MLSVDFLFKHIIVRLVMKIISPKNFTKRIYFFMFATLLKLYGLFSQNHVFEQHV